MTVLVLRMHKDLAALTKPMDLSRQVAAPLKRLPSALATAAGPKR